MKIVTCDDHDLFRAGLRQILIDLQPAAEVLEARGADALVALLAEHGDLDLVLLDLGLPDGHGLDLLARLRREHPTLTVVIVSGEEDPLLMRAAIDGGASGFLPKASPQEVLAHALRLIFAGGVYVPPDALAAVSAAPPAAAGGDDPRHSRASGLTARQREVLELLGKGLTNKEISGVLGIALGTVKAHVAAVFEALEVTNRTEAVMAMVELGLADRS